MPETIVFACTHSAGRSQMAKAFFTALPDPAQVVGEAAGTSPAAHVHPEVVTVMAELGIDLKGARPQLLNDALAGRAKMLITMGCNEQCPFIPGVERDDWALTDPKGQSLEVVRGVRDEIRRRVARLVDARGWNRVTIRSAQSGDRPAVEALLTQHRLPLDGLDAHFANALVAVDRGTVIGCAAIERHGTAALLRSVAVAPGRNGFGLGERLTQAALQLAREQGAESVSLLTTTAAPFFERHGFRAVAWDGLPSALKGSRELTGACPSSATAMLLPLN